MFNTEKKYLRVQLYRAPILIRKLDLNQENLRMIYAKYYKYMMVYLMHFCLLL